MHVHAVHSSLDFSKTRIGAHIAVHCILSVPLSPAAWGELVTPAAPVLHGGNVLQFVRLCRPAQAYMSRLLSSGKHSSSLHRQ